MVEVALVLSRLAGLVMGNLLFDKNEEIVLKKAQKHETMVILQVEMAEAIFELLNPDILEPMPIQVYDH